MNYGLLNPTTINSIGNLFFQGTEDLLASIKSSPGIPHDPAKQPDKGQR